ncbi:PBSX family phage terminase large subunit [Bacillus thuringiensis]|uniref:PBSX family phage terminase large subunit n=1 Tax=Bacillus TaxID=1386 RepID=UPI000A35DB54|nr:MULTISPECIES: PBSX family phage terminase large subunit [Bacillus cereus group]MCU5063734.1 PBSX family phage terminase large subunit [Bacillus cereus]MCU5605066.1 PBSX family phage terminase large subunit [Bacillus cereus]MCU5770405.1 PBSX family phage terminase large subunit [Bacillus cereus]MED2125951.1 PBSX family phage terminase large subunit [Bacillus thuringiensis]MED2148493.1 PBSX family phage terminase large subunit [Bacillus thuringiensis]
MKLKPAPFKFRPFSKKQLQVLTWWRKGSPVKDHDGIICDGSIRAGKTVSMALSYVMWGTETFNGENLGMAGKTIGSLRRNVITPLKKMLKSRKYKVKDHLSENMLTISKDGHMNHFYIFGGKDESSQELIQGITLAGMFFDEVALMPQSFVNQATGRCSIEGSKYWFNCNPAGPYHWFKLEWIDNKEDKNLLHIHFTMDDNLSLSEKVKQRYYRMYSGVFFQRFILGLWVLAEGIVYDMFNKEKHVVKTVEREYEKYYVSCDYGTQNPMTYGLWGLCKGIWYKTKEYHYDGRKNSRQKTDDEYLDDLKEFIGDISIRGIIVDPSAASFIALLKKNRFKVLKAKNEVIDGIRNVARLLNEEKIKYNDCCKETFREYASYTWDEKATARGEDKPNKENDHQMDGDRYFVNTVVVTNNKVKAVKSIY